MAGEDGRELASFWLAIMNDPKQKTRDRLEASKLLADRGWGKPQPLPAVLDVPGPHARNVSPATRARLSAQLDAAIEQRVNEIAALRAARLARGENTPGRAQAPAADRS